MFFQKEKDKGNDNQTNIPPVDNFEMEQYEAELEYKVSDIERKLKSMTTEMNDIVEQIQTMLLLRDSKLKFITYNFTLGLIRGLGAAVGATVLFAIILHILGQVIALNLPLISDFVSQFITMVQERHTPVQ